MAAAKEEVFNVYEENTLQINVGGEEAVDVLKGKLCEQGLKSEFQASISRQVL